MPNSYNFMNVIMQVATKAETLALIDQATPEKKVTIATVNAEFFLKAEKNSTFKQALETMTVCTIDGSGPFFLIRFWSLLKGLPQVEWYPGADMIAELLRHYQDGSKRFYLIGGAPGIAQQAATNISQKFPESVIVGSEDGGTIDSDNLQLDPDLLARIQAARPDILLVGFGAPKQELWIQQASSEISIPVMIGVGGTLEFYAAKKKN